MYLIVYQIDSINIYRRIISSDSKTYLSVSPSGNVYKRKELSRNHKLYSAVFFSVEMLPHYFLNTVNKKYHQKIFSA